VCKKLIKNSQRFGKKFKKTVGGIFLTHTVQTLLYHVCLNQFQISVHFSVTDIFLTNMRATKH